MILGMSLAAFTTLHVIISLIGIASGLVVVFAMGRGERLPGWTGVFLVTTILTSVTGFLFPPKPIGPPHVLGALSLVILALAVTALYGKHLAGAWRWLYVLTAVVALYFNVLVGVVQAFQKLPFLRSLAPTQSEPPFIVAQLLVLALFVWIGYAALKRFPAAALRVAV
jgi:hypothetical protein